MRSHATPRPVARAGLGRPLHGRPRRPAMRAVGLSAPPVVAPPVRTDSGVCGSTAHAERPRLAGVGRADLRGRGGVRRRWTAVVARHLVEMPLNELIEAIGPNAILAVKLLLGQFIGLPTSRPAVFVAF